MENPLKRAVLENRSLAIVGMSKNAGKTTVLNRLISLLEKKEELVPALTSIGRDGETTDIVTGTAKPGIWVRAGTLVATASDLLRYCDVTREILDTTGVHTPLGEVVVFRALSDGVVELAGPSMNDQMEALRDTLAGMGADIVLIDGAISRKSLAAPAVSEAVILCAGASYSPDMDTVVADTAYACGLLMLPKAEDAHGRQHMLSGAATDAATAQLALRDGDEITVRDGSRMLLSRPLYERLTARGIRFTVLRPTRLCCVCVNPFSAYGAAFDPKQFLERMAAAVLVPVLNVRGMDA